MPTKEVKPKKRIVATKPPMKAEDTEEPTKDSEPAEVGGEGGGKRKREKSKNWGNAKNFFFLHWRASSIFRQIGWEFRREISVVWKVENPLMNSSNRK